MCSETLSPGCSRSGRRRSSGSCHCPGPQSPAAAPGRPLRTPPGAARRRSPSQRACSASPSARHRQPQPRHSTQRADAAIPPLRADRLVPAAPLVPAGRRDPHPGGGEVRFGQMQPPAATGAQGLRWKSQTGISSFFWGGVEQKNPENNEEKNAWCGGQRPGVTRLSWPVLAAKVFTARCAGWFLARGGGVALRAAGCPIPAPSGAGAARVSFCGGAGEGERAPALG